MGNNNIQQTTFWEFLQKKCKIEIPIIQRDYAQGRIGKEKLREKFLADLKKALDSPLPKDEKVLKLDFVYGNLENDKLNPLDGQQRLTTLWLLHWYIAFKAGTLMENKAVFKNFSYETRISSREFCNKLSDFDVKQEGEIVSLIQKQTWFFSVWKQDPTIQAMLNMLGGTPIKDNKKNDILDGIEEVFNDCDYSGYWEKLISKDCPIIFYYLDLEGLSLSDDLYIKMNARGKNLTNFENFKADLVGFIKEKGWEDEWKKERINNRLEKDIERHNEILKDEDNPNKTFSHKLDTDWTNIFWIYKSKEHKIDDIYFAFLNRYFLHGIVTTKKPDGSYLYTQDRLLQCASKEGFDKNYVESEEYKKLKSGYNTFKTLYGSSSDDSRIIYRDYDIYNPKNEEIDIFRKDLFERLTKVLDNFQNAFNSISKEDINKLFLPSWDVRSNSHFIPEYENNSMANGNNNEPKFTSTSLTQPQRVVFFAICSYFENNRYNDISFKQWMRVVWNIVENVNIETIPAMIGTMRLLDELKPSANNIYNFLADSSTVIKSDTAKEQVAEEIEKAKQIVNDTTNTWESKIIEAEKTAFFKGAIRFLFRADINTYDWRKFDDRLGKAKQYFDEKGVKSEYRENAKLICTLISLFTKWKQCWGDKKIKIGNGTEVWSYIIRNDNLLQPLVDLLDLDAIPLEITNFSSRIDKFDDGYGEIEKLAHEDMCNNGLINEAINIMDEGILLNWRNNQFVLYRPNASANWKKYIIGNMRNKIIFDLRENGIISTDQNISGIPYFWGWEIYFTSKLNNKRYQWWDKLKEQTENGEWEEVQNVNLDSLEEYLNRYLKNPIGEQKQPEN